MQRHSSKKETTELRHSFHISVNFVIDSKKCYLYKLTITSYRYVNVKQNIWFGTKRDFLKFLLHISKEKCKTFWEALKRFICAMIISSIGALQQVDYNISMWQNRCSLKDFGILQNVKTTAHPLICERCEIQQIYIYMKR